MKSAGSKRSARMGNPAKDVDSYIAAAPKAAQKTLRALRKTIRSAAPDAVEVISYGIPAYKHHGQLVFFAAFEDHCSFFPASKEILKTFGSELKPFDASVGTIRFHPERPLPASLVRRIVKTRVAQNELKAKKRS